MVLKKAAPVQCAPLQRHSVAEPKPQAQEVLIGVHACGVCRTDLHQVEGDLEMRARPAIPGHQIVGTVCASGPGTQERRVGDRVGVAWLHQTCGQCEFCRSNRENLCMQARFTGWDTPGGYAQYCTAPAAFVYALPITLDAAHAAPLLCGGIIGYRALRRCRIEPGQRLGLYGFGASAHVAIQVARHWQCETYIFSRSAAHRRLAINLGAAWAGSAEDTPPAKLHGSVLFAPSGALVLPALEHLESGGTLALAGIHMTPVPEMGYRKYLYNEKTLTSVANATRRDGEELLQLAATIPIRTAVQTFGLEQANEALQALKAGTIQGAAVLMIKK